MNQLFNETLLLGGDPCDGGSWTCLGTTDVSPPVKNNTAQNEPAGWVDVPTRVKVHVMGDKDMCREHRHLTACQKQHRQNKPAGQVDVPTMVEVHVTGDP